MNSALSSSLPAPLGATWDGSATTLRVASVHATAIEVEFDGASGVERASLTRQGDTWSARIPAPPGTRYALRADGPWDPAAGHLFNPAKLLLDPCARMIDGPVRWHPSMKVARHDGRVLLRDSVDSAAHLPRCVVAGNGFDWKDDHSPVTPWADTVIYECHVKGMTALHPEVDPRHRGTYLGLSSAPVIAHLKSLGVTAVELLPVHPAADSAHLVRIGKTNYWGYASVGFFAPDGRFATETGRELSEFREMVRQFHAAGIEVLLDVVYNHTGEGGIDGAGMLFRGLDNASYYRLKPDGGYEDLTGCGNTLDIRQRIVCEMVLESLRFWIREMHVDGFRFDLAPVLGRDPAAFDAAAAFFREVAADPLLARAKLIAEPWDLGPEGYQLGRFPAPFVEWNGKFRDSARRFWRGAGGIADLATRITGSSDLFHGRSPQASVNFITCHDGFTLADLVSYSRKHNLENGERNRDGADWSESWNGGVEGPTADLEIREARSRAMRALWATLALSLGVPMLNQGDEVGHTQQGNNNPWCQDSALTWMPWTRGADASALLAFVQQVMALRSRYPAFRSTLFPAAEGAVPGSVEWLDERAQPMTADAWQATGRHQVAAALHTPIIDAGGRRDGWCLLVLNGGATDGSQQLPAGEWTLVLDTTCPGSRAARVTGAIEVGRGGLLLLERAATS